MSTTMNEAVTMNEATLESQTSTAMNEALMSTSRSRRAVAFVEGLKDDAVKTRGSKVPQALSVQNLSALNISEVYFYSVSSLV